MDSLPSNSAPRPARISTGTRISIVVIAVMIALVLAYWEHSRPSLDLRNTGSEPVLIEHAGSRMLIPPGQSQRIRYNPGDQLVASPAADEIDLTVCRSVVLEGHPLPTAAEVVASSQQGVTVRLLGGGR